MSMISFIKICLCRKTSVVFGGAGPASAIAFAPHMNPEKLLQGISANVAAAAAFKRGGTAAAAPHTPTGAAKDAGDPEAAAVAAKGLRIPTTAKKGLPVGEAPLPAGWTREVDGDGDAYFISPAGVSQWERPTE
jgi:hypothetical protein